MHPFVRILVVAVVALIVAGALVAFALLGRNTSASVIALLVAGVIGIVIGCLVFVQGWIWSQRSWQHGFSGRSAAIALAGGLGIVVAAVALAATVILLLTFGIG